MAQPTQPATQPATQPEADHYIIALLDDPTHQVTARPDEVAHAVQQLISPRNNAGVQSAISVLSKTLQGHPSQHKLNSTRTEQQYLGVHLTLAVGARTDIEHELADAPS